MLINDVNKLQSMNSNLSGNYALGRDIDASATKGWSNGAGFAPIGTPTGLGGYSGKNQFTGQFDGNDKTISGLYINLPDKKDVGLFSHLDFGSSIKNVTLANSSITGGAAVGGIVGSSNASTLAGITITGVTVKAIYDGVGGIIGNNLYYLNSVVNSTVSNSTITGRDYVGGAVGQSGMFYSVGVRDTAVSGRDYVGGITGSSSGIF